MDFKKIRDFAGSVLPKEKSPNQFTFKDIVAGLNGSGFYVPEWTVRRQIKKLNIAKGDRGYYSPADAALIVGWNMRRGQYSSCQQYYKHEGARLYEIAQTQLC